MKQVAGAVVVLAGAVLVGAGIIANALLEAANRLGQPGTTAAVGGVIVGLVGVVIYFRGVPPEPQARSNAWLSATRGPLADCPRPPGRLPAGTMFSCPVRGPPTA